MDIFIAWSGPASQRLALALYKWLPDVMQAVKPFMSTESIRSGSTWLTDIGAKLEAAHFAILCATPTNLTSPWMHFEAGAVSKHIAKAKVCALLLDVKANDLQMPLAQFQHREAIKSEIFELVVDINRATGDTALELERLQRMFGNSWGVLELGLKEARAALTAETGGHKPKGPTERELLENLTTTTRAILERMDRNATRERVARRVVEMTRPRALRSAGFQLKGFQPTFQVDADGPPAIVVYETDPDDLREPDAPNEDPKSAPKKD
jgi:hypothetical protein